MLPSVPVYNSSNETLFYQNGQLISLMGKNNLYIPVSKEDQYNDSINSSSFLQAFERFTLPFSVSVCSVFNLQLHTGPHLLLSVPEDKLRAEDGYHVDSCCGLQHHYPTNTCPTAG